MNEINAARMQADLDRDTIAGLRLSADVDARALATLRRDADVDTGLIAQLQREAVIDRDMIENLELALVSSRRIGTAVGILMNQHKITADAAFDLLVKASQAGNRKLRDIADDVAETGAIG